MRRILHLLPSPEPSWALRQCYRVRHGLPSDAFKIDCVMLEGPSRLDLPKLRQLREMIRVCEAEIIHAWTVRDWWLSAAALQTNRRRKLIVSLGRCERRFLQRKVIDRLVMARTAAIVVTSQPFRQALVAAGWPEEKIHVIGCAVDHPYESEGRVLDLRTKFAIPADQRLVGATCPMVPSENVKDLIWAADLLKVVRDDVQVVIFGDGPQRMRLEKFRRQVRIEDRVHFAGGELDAARHLPELDVFWMSRTQPGQPLALLEAMAAGVPVVAFDTPDTRAILESEQSGLLVPRGGRAELAAATQRLIDDPALARRLAEAASAHVKENFSCSRACEAYASLYRQLCR